MPAGSFYGIVGPNGAGKTTTLSMATGLLRPDFGTALVHGVDVWAQPLEAKKLMGVLPDGVRLFDRLTGEQLVTYAGLLRGMDKDVVAARVAELLAALDLRPDAGTLVVDYSAGMTKKIALASALIHAPRLLVLDEPFESVDPVSAANIRGHPGPLRGLRRDGHCLQPRHGPGPAYVRPRRSGGRRAGAGGRDRGRSPRRGLPGGPLRPAGGRPEPDGGTGMVAHLLRLKMTLAAQRVQAQPVAAGGHGHRGPLCVGIAGPPCWWPGRAAAG